MRETREGEAGADAVGTVLAHTCVPSRESHELDRRRLFCLEGGSSVVRVCLSLIRYCNTYSDSIINK